MMSLQELYKQVTRGQRHLPLPGAVGGLARSDGTDWQRVEENSLASYILHSLADAENDFLVASGANVFVKKTIAEVVAILEAILDHGNLQGLSDGADHSFIDQDVTIGSSPVLDGANFTGVSTSPEYSDVSGNDAGTDVTASELEELTDASETTLHSHAADADTIHDNVAGEINAIATKVAPVDADVVLIEDSEDSFNKKKILKSTLGGATTADHADISANDVDTDVTGAELEELTDGSETTLHSHAGGGAGGVAVGGAFAAEWKIDGVMSVTVEVGGAFVVPDDATIQAVLAHAKVPGSAGSTILDVNINAVTAYSTQGNRPTLAYDDADGVVIATDPDVTDVVAGDIITIDIDQVATGASGLSVTILLTGTEEISYTFVSDADSDTNVTGLELEELTDGSETTLHSHAIEAEYSDVSGNDGDTDVSGAELEELTDGSETTLHSHAGGGGGGADLLEVQIFS